VQWKEMILKSYTKIIALETALDGVGVGYYDAASGKQQAAYEQTIRGQAEIVVPMVQDVLAAAGTEFADLDAVVTVLGPGSFTGVRLGLSVAESFGLALDLPVYGLSSLQAMALQYVSTGAVKRDICVVLETRRSDFYAQIFTATGAPLSQGGSLEQADLEALLGERNVDFIGNAAERYSGNASALNALDPAFLARLLADQPDALLTDLSPIYLRGADVSISKKIQRVLAD